MFPTHIYVKRKHLSVTVGVKLSVNEPFLYNATKMLQPQHILGFRERDVFPAISNILL